MWLLLELLDAAVCRQHTDQRCPTELMCLRSIRGEQPIKLLLRFTQQLKPNRRSEPSGLLEWMYKHRRTQQHTCFIISAFHSHAHALQARKGQTLKLWRQSRDCWWWKAKCRVQVTSSSPLSSRCRASSCISVKSRCVETCHCLYLYLHLFNHQNDQSVSGKQTLRFITDVTLNQANVVFSNLTFIGDAIIVQSIKLI